MKNVLRMSTKLLDCAGIVGGDAIVDCMGECGGIYITDLECSPLITIPCGMFPEDCP